MVNYKYKIYHNVKNLTVCYRKINKDNFIFLGGNVFSITNSNVNFIYEFNKEYIKTLHCHIITIYFVLHNKNDVLFERVYIKTRRLLFAFPFTGNFGHIFRFWFPEGIFHAAPLSSLAAFFLSVISLTLFMYILILSNSCFTGCSLGLTP
ncbi:unnamed protein product [Pipistrellus nathusii]|uniref:Uncharacterized protein n=1 Tax=Pipistrellus nathusii TaxID=59473 RepID=A0ABN9ZTM7_PIPNA